MIKNLKLIALFAALLAVAVLAGCSTPASRASDVPQFSFSSLEGKTVAMKDLGNKVVIVDFWATWCGPCREEIPHLNELYSELKGKGLEIVGISMDTDGTDGVKAEEVYFTRKMQNHHGGMIVIDGCLYGAHGGNEGGSLVCLDFKTGAVLWDAREDERKVRKGSVALADGQLYYRTEQCRSF